MPDHRACAKSAAFVQADLKLDQNSALILLIVVVQYFACMPWIVSVSRMNMIAFKISKNSAALVFWVAF